MLTEGEKKDVSNCNDDGYKKESLLEKKFFSRG